MGYGEVKLAETEAISETESLVARLGGRQHAVLTGSGTAALTLACGLANAERPRVVIPAIACANVMYAVLYAGKQPVLADVQVLDVTIDPGHVETLLSGDKGIGAVVAVHLYGHRADMDALAEICERYGVMLIEDAAQAVGGNHPDGRPLGAAGDVAVLSFGRTKILDAGGGGALLLDNSAWMTRVRAASQKLPKPTKRMGMLAGHYSRLFYAILEASWEDNRFLRMFHAFPDLFCDLFIHAAEPEQAQRILALLPTLRDELSHRRELHALYSRELRGVEGVHIFGPAPGSAPWRFSFRVARGHRRRVLEKLRNAGYDASAWYPCLAGWAPTGSLGNRDSVPCAASLDMELINLWVTRAYTQEMAINVVAVVKEALASRKGIVDGGYSEPALKPIASLSSEKRLDG